MDEKMKIEWERMLLDPVFWYNKNIPKWQGQFKGYSPPLRDSSQYPIIIEFIVSYFNEKTGVSKKILRKKMVTRIPCYLRLN
jgi:hypothetical protein